VHAIADELTAEDVTRGKVASLTEGEPAPFTGVILSQAAAATLFGDLKFTKRECQLTLEKELQLNTATMQSHINAIALRLQIEEEKLQSLLMVKNKRIEFLEKNWQPESWYESGEFWLATGVMGGILVTVAASYALSHAAK
jgi:hypothetical protein